MPGDADAQTRLVLDKIAAILGEYGLAWPAVVKLTYYVCDPEDIPALRTVLREVLPDPKPVATLAVVRALVDGRFLVEIDAVADLSAAAIGLSV